MVVTDGIPLLHLSIPTDVFGIDRTAAGVPPHRVLLVAAELGPVTSEGVTVVADHGLEALRCADLVLVPWSRFEEEPPQALMDALVDAHAHGSVIAAMCGGSFVLAAAGLLDGRAATTHWLHVDELESRFPRLRVDRDSIFVDEGNVLTCAGTTAGIDLCLHLLRRFNGAGVAAAVARRMVTSPRLGAQVQTPHQAIAARSEADPIDAVAEWALRHLQDGIGVEDLAARACMSRRHFHRRFREVTGVSPHQWLVAQRVRLAEQLLENTGLPVETIAHKTGFGSPLAFRTHFVKVHDVPPRDYRSLFRASAAASGPPQAASTSATKLPESVA
ncbi:MAG TPA: helix-turn-helix domain-containing protein [Nocardioides sp.]|nr:helix-turn-helix domain-containing protein [Nocardioides sp.]